MAKLRVVLEKELVPWAEKEGLRYVSHLDVERLRAFRSSWADNAVSAMKKIEQLRSFFRFANDSGWVEDGSRARFRDTFAVELLLAGVSLEQVSILLEHCYGRRTTCPG